MLMDPYRDGNKIAKNLKRVQSACFDFSLETGGSSRKTKKLCDSIDGEVKIWDSKVLKGVPSANAIADYQEKAGAFFSVSHPRSECELRQILT